VTATDFSFSPLTLTNIHTVHEYDVKFRIVSSGATKAVDKSQIASTKDTFAPKTNIEKTQKRAREMKADFSTVKFKKSTHENAFIVALLIKFKNEQF